jgi:putative ABC transport system permease protein
MYDDAAPDEAVVNEAFRARYGVDVGDRVDLHLLSPAELADGVSGATAGATFALDVVGVLRSEQDLNAALGEEAFAVLQTPVGVEPMAAGAATLYRTIMIRTTDDAVARQAIDQAFAGRAYNSGFTYSPDDIVPLEDAYGYEARAALAFAIVTALAGVIFVGQALARQVRREWSDGAALRALGMSRAQTGWSCVVRATPIAIGATLVAAATVVALSPLTPAGTARAALLGHGAHVDVLVLAIGLPVLAALVLGIAWFPVWRGGRPRARAAVEERQALHALGAPPPASVGVAFALQGPASGTGLPVGTAVVGVALGALALVAGAGLVASLDRLVDTPRLYGAVWDLSVAGPTGTSPTDVPRVLEELDGVERAGALLGTELLVDGESTWMMAIDGLSPDLPVPAPTISRGREPVRPLEVALGSLTLERLGVDLGDEVDLATTITGGGAGRYTVVGEVVVNSTDEGSPGLGGLALPQTLRQFDRSIDRGIAVVDLADGPAGDAARTAILEAYPGGEVSGPVRQPAIGNIARLRPLPYVLAVLVAVLAAGSLAHALVVSLRRNRQQLAVLKAIGFTRRQVSAAVACQATTLAGLALVIGIPVGVLLARWGWYLVADQLGVTSPPVVPPLAVLAVAAAVLVFANLAALWPGRRAALVPAAAALRVE